MKLVNEADTRGDRRRRDAGGGVTLTQGRHGRRARS